MTIPSFSAAISAFHAARRILRRGEPNFMIPPSAFSSFLFSSFLIIKACRQKLNPLFLPFSLFFLKKKVSGPHRQDITGYKMRRYKMRKREQIKREAGLRYIWKITESEKGKICKII